VSALPCRTVIGGSFGIIVLVANPYKSCIDAPFIPALSPLSIILLFYLLLILCKFPHLFLPSASLIDSGPWLYRTLAIAAPGYRGPTPSHLPKSLCDKPPSRCLPRDAMHSAVMRLQVVCMSVYLYACPSVTLRYVFHTSWNTSKVILRPCMMSASACAIGLVQREHPKIRVE